MIITSTRETFDRQLKSLLENVLVLGSMVEQAIQQSIIALRQNDRKAARLIYENDQRINERRYTIESECVRLIATQQPMGFDVRFLAAILEIITELERIGDYAKGISKINLLLNEEMDDPDIYLDLQQMSFFGLEMLRRALDAFVKGDAAAARLIPADDDKVDQYYNLIHRKLIDRVIAEPKIVDQANLLMWAAHNLERMADRVINICERIIYVSTGEVKELDKKDGIDMDQKPHNPDIKPALASPINRSKVLFLCTHNSARSQMAEAFLRLYAGERYEAFSAGLEAGGMNAYTLRVMKEIGIDLSGHHSKPLTEYLGKVHFSYLITVCDHAEQQCPIFPGMGTRLHWPFENPAAAVGSEDEILNTFRRVRDEIKAQVLAWISSDE